jgi:hypothetical protein
LTALTAVTSKGASYGISQFLFLVEIVPVAQQQQQPRHRLQRPQQQPQLQQRQERARQRQGQQPFLLRPQQQQPLVQEQVSPHGCDAWSARAARHFLFAVQEIP